MEIRLVDKSFLKTWSILKVFTKFQWKLLYFKKFLGKEETVMKTNSLYGVSAVTFAEAKIFEDRNKGVPYRLF